MFHFVIPANSRSKKSEQLSSEYVTHLEWSKLNFRVFFLSGGSEMLQMAETLFTNHMLCCARLSLNCSTRVRCVKLSGEGEPDLLSRQWREPRHRGHCGSSDFIHHHHLFAAVIEEIFFIGVLNYMK